MYVEYVSKHYCGFLAVSAFVDIELGFSNACAEIFLKERSVRGSDL